MHVFFLTLSLLLVKKKYDLEQYFVNISQRKKTHLG